MLLAIVYIILYMLVVLATGLPLYMLLAGLVDEHAAKTYGKVHCWIWEIIILGMALTHWNPLNIAIG